MTELPWLAGTAVLYALLAKLVLTFYSSNGLVTIFWPGSGISLAALLLGGRKFWVSIYIGSLAGELWVGNSLGVASAISLGSVLEPLLGIWLLNRHGGFDTTLPSSRDLFRLFYIAGALSPVVCAPIGVGSLILSESIGADMFGREVALWWMGDTLGIVVVAPLILVWRRPFIQPANVAETVGVLGLALLAGQVIFLGWLPNSLGLVSRGYWMYLLISWAAVRLGLHAVLLIVFTATVQALTGAALGAGFFANDLAETQLTNFWAYIAILATVGTALAAIFAERERVAAQLRSSEGRYGSLFDNMLDGFAHCRMIYERGRPVDYEYITVNPAFEKVTGLKNVVGRKISEIIPGYYRDNRESCEMFGLVAESGQPLRWEHYLASHDKHFAFSIFCPAKGEFIAIIENISERRRVESELHKLSLAVAQSPASIVITDKAARIEYVNPAFCHISGYAAEEAIGQNPRILQSRLTPRQTYDELWAALTQCQTWRGEFINRRKDGTHYIERATISPVRQADGRVTHYLAVKEDVTERRRAAAELYASEQRLQLARNATNLGIFDLDLVTGTLVWDDKVRELWGIGPDEPVTYETFLAGIHPADRAERQKTMDRALDPAGGGAYHAEYRVVAKATGVVRHIAATGQVQFESGRPVRFTGMVQDISERKQLERELQERRGEMAALAKQQVAVQTAAAIAHELNQPLVAISAYGEVALRVLRGGTLNMDKLTRALEGSVEQANRAGRTLHELLDFLHQGETAAAPLDLNDMIREAIAIAREDGYGGFQSNLELEPGLPPVMGNRLQVQKVLVNLLHNGVDAMREAGVAAAAITITVQTAAGQSMAQVTVRDSGPGLDAATAARVFEPFFTTKPSGIGLGLAISRALIEAHGGQLWLDPDDGPGATFHFTLPFAP